MSFEREIPLNARLACREREIIDWVGSSFRGIRHPLIRELGDIANEVSGKVVADFGSGGGGLAKSAFIEGIDTTIWSINPALGNPVFDASQKKVSLTRTYLQEDYPEVTDEQIEAAQSYHDKHRSTNFAHNLSDFPDNFFDFGLDHFAVHAYMPKGDVEIYDVTIGEMMRVMKPGGKLLVGHIGRVDLWADGGIGTVALARRGLSYNPIYGNTSYGAREWRGVTIIKPHA